MRLRHPDYIKLVIETYHKKRANNELSLLLAQPTPASLRQECVNVYQERYEKKDENALRAFFGTEEPDRKLIEIIQDFEIDKFRPLVSYLKRSDKKGVKGKNLELLAWLINFQHRPHIYDKEVLLSDVEKSILGLPGFNEGIKQPESGKGKDKLEENPITIVATPGIFAGKEIEGQTSLQTASTDSKQRKKSERAVIIFLILLICIGGVYTLWQAMQINKMTDGEKTSGCMYWKSDHFEEIPCNEDRKGMLKLAMDRERMYNFRRILKEDTITEKSINVVHYIKIYGTIEYYTTGGNHPVEVTRRLWPLSEYMFNKYLGKQKKKDSLSEPDRKFVSNP